MAVDKKINELAQVTDLTDDLLIVIGSATDGRIFNTTLGELKAYLGGTVVPPKLSTPQLTVVLINTTTINVSITGDAHTEQHILRLATNAQFTTGLRNATVTAPQNTYSFTGLPPGTLHFIELIDKANGYLDSDPVTDTASTSSVVVPGFPYSFPQTF